MNSVKDIDIQPIFRGVSLEEQHLIESKIQSVKFPRHSYIFNAGDSANHLYLVREGVVKLSYVQEGGEEKIIHVAQSPDLFGHLFLGTYRHRVGTAYALSSVTLYRLTEEQLLDLIQKIPIIAINLICYFADTQRELLARLHATMHLNAYYRVLGTLHCLARHSCCSANQWFKLSPYISQKDIANIACVNRSTANQVLQELKARGIVVQKGRELLIHRVAIRALLQENGLEILV